VPVLLLLKNFSTRLILFYAVIPFDSHDPLFGFIFNANHTHTVKSIIMKEQSRKPLFFLVWVLLLPISVWAWSSDLFLVQNNPFRVGSVGPRRGRNVNDVKSKTTALHVFGWFKGGETKDDFDKSDEAVSANLAGVTGIMDSMASFKVSLRVSDRTNAALQDLANTIVEGTAADGKVKITYNGQQQPVNIFIDEGYFLSLSRKNGAAELSNTLIEAMQEGQKKAAAKMEDKLKTLYSDLGFDTT
jgi:DNA-binding protein YbaB